MSNMDKHLGEMIQQQLPIALVRGEKVVEKPTDLFIPKRALEIHLNEFEGPLDLLLYLIKKQKFDILDLPIAPITSQYFHYIESINEQGIELAAEYLLMAATLAEIKSRLLLPKQIIEDEELDPRAELVRKLQEYELMKQASRVLEGLPQMGRDIHAAQVALADNLAITEHHEDVGLEQLVQAFQRVLSYQAAFEHHHIQKESISTQQRIEHILTRLSEQADQSIHFVQCIETCQGRSGVIVTFLALLELLKSGMISCQLTEHKNEISIRLVA